MLRASSAALDEQPDLRAVVGGADAGIAHAAELSAFAEAAWRRDETLGPAREALRAAVGDAGLGAAAATVAIFRSLNIAADTSGIPLDESFADQIRPTVLDLGLDRFTTAANTPGYATG